MISENTTRIVAKISGDGHLSKKQVMYFNTSKILINEFKEDIKETFGDVRMSEGTMSSGTPYVAVYGSKIVNFLIDFLPSYNSTKIFIPQKILNLGDNILKEYIRAFYDDEGCASLRLNKKTKEWKRNITLSSNSYKILQQIKGIFEQWNIKTNKIIKNNQSSSYDRSFLLSITGKENFILFHKKIGFKHPRKKKMVELIIQSYEATSRNKLEFNKLKEKLKSVPRI